MVIAKISFGTNKTYMYAFPEAESFNLGHTNISVNFPKGIDRFGHKYYSSGRIIELYETKTVPEVVTKAIALESTQSFGKKILVANVTPYKDKETQTKKPSYFHVEAERAIIRKFLDSLK